MVAFQVAELSFDKGKCMKNSVMLKVLASLFLIVAGSSFLLTDALAQDCYSNESDQRAYEDGVDKGRKHATSNKGYMVEKAVKRAKLRNDHQRNCFEKGYETGYDNASADMHKGDSSSGNREKNDYDDNPYREGTNEFDYYVDGCRAGREDGEANMSSVYERYSDQYDSRFEQSFREGYESCWSKYR
jgi:hypothetical protein